jgi:hypothetical protein
MQGERRGIQVNQPNANQARVPPQDPPSKEMNQRINGVQSILKQGNKKRSPKGHNDRKGKDKKFTQLDKQSNSGCRSGENLQHYARMATSRSAKEASKFAGDDPDSNSNVPVSYLYGKGPSRELVDDFENEEPPEGSSAFMRPYNGHGGAEDDDDEPVFISVNGGAPMQLTYPKCTIAHVNDCTQSARQRLCYPTKPGPTAQPESVTSGLTTTSSLPSVIEDLYSSLASLEQTVRQPTVDMQLMKKSYIPQKLIWDIMPEPEWLSHKMDNYSASVTKSGPPAQPESVNSDRATSSSLASAVQDSRSQAESQLEPTAGYKLRSTRISKPPQRFKPYAKPEHINSVLATNCPREYKGHHDGDPTPNFGEPSATPSTQPRAEVKES